MQVFSKLSEIMINTFEKHLQEASRFIKNLAMQLGTPDDTDHAVRVLRSVFRALRRRIIPDESLHIVSQLPLVLKGMYVNHYQKLKLLMNSCLTSGIIWDKEQTRILRAMIWPEKKSQRFLMS